MKKFVLSAAAAAFVSTAGATPFVIDIGADVSGNGDTFTSPVDNLGFTGTTFYTVFLDNNTNVGSSVRVTNSVSVLNTYGFGTTGLPAPKDPDTINIDTLNTGVADGNGFTNGVSAPAVFGFFGLWGLTYSLDLTGTITNGGFINYTGGTVTLYYRDSTVPPGTKVAELDVTGSNNNINQLSLSGVLDYSWVDANPLADLFVKNFFSDVASGQNFYDIDPEALSFRINATENPTTITQSTIVSNEPQTFLFRRTTLDGNISFNVPEPTSIALVGLALTGLAVATRRRRKQA